MPDIQRFYFCTGPLLILDVAAPKENGLVRVVYQPQGRDTEYNFAIWCREETDIHKALTNAHENGEVIAVDGYAQEGDESGKYYHHACQVYHGDEPSLPRFKPAKDHVPATEDGKPIVTYSRDDMIARQSALKSAVVCYQGITDYTDERVLETADKFLNWLTGGNAVTLPPKESESTEPAGNGQKPPATPAPPVEDVTKNRIYTKFSAMFKAAREQSKLKEFGEKLSFETPPQAVRDRLATEYKAAEKRIAAQQTAGAAR